MAMLNFKYGLHKNLPAYDSTKAGTIFVTSDERAMYVDLPSGRVRLSQIITCTFDEWQALTPPFSTEAFYYIIDKNALLKYKESAPDAGYEAGWVQINSTADISSALSALADRVTEVERVNGEQNTLITNLGTRVETLEETVYGKEAAEGSEAVIGLVEKVQALEEVSQTFATKEEAQGYAKDVQGDTTKTVAGVDSELSGVKTTVGEHTTQITSILESIEGLEDTIEENMQAADAMVFKDTVSSASDLPTTGEIGWTYKAIEEFTLTQGEGESTTIIPVYIGDLLIATGTETDGQLTSITWKHVPSGYTADYNPEMSVNLSDENEITVNLSSGVNKDGEAEDKGDLGAFKLKSDSNIKIGIDANTILFSMEWGSFD